MIQEPHSSRTPTDPPPEARIRIAGHEIRWDFAAGQVTFDGVPMIFVWRDTTLAWLMDSLRRAVGEERLSLALQAGGRDSVDQDWIVISGSARFEDGFRAISHVASVAGWGHLRLVWLDRDARRACFQVADGWEGRIQKALGVCWGSGMIAGKMAGYCTRLFETNCWAEQTRFIARGDDCDEFVVGPSSRTIETEIENLLLTDQATRADMAVAMRNLQDEIRRRGEAEEALRQSEARYRGYVDNAPEGVFIVDGRGRYLDVNPTGCEMLGYSREELTARMIADVGGGGPDVVSEAFARLKGDGALQAEMTFRRKDGSSFPGFLSARRLGEDRYIGFLSDITDLQNAERDRLKYERQFLEILSATQDLTYRINLVTGRHDYLSPRAAEILGLTPEEVKSRGVNLMPDGLHPEDRQHLDAILQSFLHRTPDSDGTLTEQPIRVEFRWRKDADSPYRWFSDVWVVIFDADGRPEAVVGNSRDITEMKLTQDRLQSLTQRLLNVQETEARRLAMELHDSVSQDLVSLQLRLQALLPTDAPAAEGEPLRLCVQQCRRLINDVRGICHGLYPPALQTLGLPRALEMLMAQYRGVGPRLSLVIGDDVAGQRFGDDVEIAVYRVAQEALANAVKHASAARVRIELDCEEGLLSLRVEDDGRGFAIGQVGDRGLGLQSMQQRSRALGAALEIRSGSNGTAVHFSIPLVAPN